MVFKGIKAQYILYLAVGLVSLLLLFAILYVIGISIYLCLGIIIPGGLGLFSAVKYYSDKYGEHGLKKKAAFRNLPAFIRSLSRNIFITLNRATRPEADQDPGKYPTHL